MIAAFSCRYFHRAAVKVRQNVPAKDFARLALGDRLPVLQQQHAADILILTEGDSSA